MFVFLVLQVLLMSLKAGGVGINLTTASNAFVMVRFHIYSDSCKQILAHIWYKL